MFIAYVTIESCQDQQTNNAKMAMLALKIGEMTG